VAILTLYKTTRICLIHKAKNIPSNVKDGGNNYF